MASRKPARSTPGQTRTADSPARSASGSSRRGGGQNAARQNASAQGSRSQNDRTGSNGTRSARPQNDAARSNRNQNARGGQGGRGPGQDSRSGQAGQAGRATATQARLAATTVASGNAATALRPPPPLWFRITTLVLSVGGLGMSVYLTIAHYTTTAILACANKGYVDCAKVTTSSQSIVFGIFPVAVLGLAFYVFMVAINSPWAWGSLTSRFPVIPWIRTAGIITGIGFVLYLVYAEVIQIGNICLLCTTVHGITFLLFVLLMSVAPFLSTSQPAKR